MKAFRARRNSSSFKAAWRPSTPTLPHVGPQGESGTLCSPAAHRRISGRARALMDNPSHAPEAASRIAASALSPGPRRPRQIGYPTQTTFRLGLAAAVVFETVRLIARPLTAPLPAKRRGEGARTDMTSRPPTRWHFGRILTELRLAVPSPRLFAGRGRVRGVGDWPRGAGLERSSEPDRSWPTPVVPERPSPRAIARKLADQPAPQCAFLTPPGNRQIPAPPPGPRCAFPRSPCADAPPRGSPRKSRARGETAARPRRGGLCRAAGPRDC